MKVNKLVAVSVVLALALSCSTQSTPTLLGGKPLDEKYSSPDGLTIGKDGCIYLSMNQSSTKWKNKASIVRITADDRIEDFFELPVNAVSGKCSPLGLVFAKDGNMYVSDNQGFCQTAPNSSGVIKVAIENGKATKGDLVVSGFNQANGMTTWGDYIFVAETDLGTKDKYTSGVYRFALSELSAGDTLMVTGQGDPHLILSFETKSPKHKVGANGLAFDSKGILYVNNFGDAQVLKYILDEKGNVKESSVLCNAEGLESVDGMQIDSDDNIWTADYVGNAVAKIDTKTGKTTIVSKNAVPVDGTNGLLDAPSECIKRGNKLYVSNIDTDYDKQTLDSVQTISVIELK